MVFEYVPGRTLRNSIVLGGISTTVESRALPHLESITAGKRDFHVHGWASGPWKLKTPHRVRGSRVRHRANRYAQPGSAEVQVGARVASFPSLEP